MYTQHKPNPANFERRMRQYSSTPRMSVVKQLLNRLVVELEAVGESERVGFNDNFSLFEQMKNIEIDIIRHALLLTNNNQRLAAQMLGINNTTLNSKMKRYGIGGKAGPFGEEV